MTSTSRNDDLRLPVFNFKGLKMQVILITQLRKRGKIGDLIEVKDGYARNYLLPNGLAVLPGEKAVISAIRNKQLEKQQSKNPKEIEEVKVSHKEKRQLRQQKQNENSKVK